MSSLLRHIQVCLAHTTYFIHSFIHSFIHFLLKLIQSDVLASVSMLLISIKFNIYLSNIVSIVQLGL